MSILRAPYIFSLIFLVSVAQAQNSSSALYRRTVAPVNDSSEDYKRLADVKWKYKTGGKVFSSPVVSKGIVFIGSEDTFLYAIDIASGKPKWKFKTGGAVHSSPSVFDGTVYVGSFDGYFYAIDARSGKEKWKVKTGGEKWMGGIGYFGLKPPDKYSDDPWEFFLSSPVVDFQPNALTIYFGSSDGCLYSVDGSDGSVRWKYQTDGMIHTTPLLYNRTIYFGGWDASFYAIDADSGQLKWKFKTGTDPGMTGIQASASVYNNRIFFGARDAFFYSLDADTGEMIWKYDAEKSWILSTAVIEKGVIYVGTSDSYLLLALDAATGKERYRFKAKGYIYASPAISGRTILFGDFTGKMFTLDINSEGHKWSDFDLEGRKANGANVLTNDHQDFRHAGEGKDLSTYAATVEVMNRFYTLGPIVSSATVQGSAVYFGSADGYVYAINLDPIP